MSKKCKNDPATQARILGLNLARAHPVLTPLAAGTYIHIDIDQCFLSGNALLCVAPSGTIWLHPMRRAAPETWARLAGIALVCLGFHLVRRQEPYVLWEIASILTANRFCEELKLGALPEEMQIPEITFPAGGAEGLLRQFCMDGCPQTLSDWYAEFSRDSTFFCNLEQPLVRVSGKPQWRDLLADGIAQGVRHALQVASGTIVAGGAAKSLSRAQRAKRRLIDHYPLLGALAASFDIEEDVRSCQQYEISVAAINVETRRIWMNPTANLSTDECIFVFAHELLHAGLNHASRRRGRDPLLWNIACDFVINGWLVEMAVGTPPHIGVLFDVKFADLSSEEIYDLLAKDLRRARKLATLRGVGEPDMLGDECGNIFTDAETYCRRALAQGLDRHVHGGNRGSLPAGLIEEIRSLSQPPIPWDVKLAQWFDERFPPLETRRSYARPSRRQSATPDIARPSSVKQSEEDRKSRVFGVLLDTSGSMEPQLLGKALGAIASYSLARDVFAVRLICCDALAYDSGWIEPERLLDRFNLHGRGGTVLQPGLDLFHDLAGQGNFPLRGPLLVITDGFCEDNLQTAMDHAFLLPEGRRLPFRARGEIFSMK